MNIGNELYFAPRFSFASLGDFSDKPKVLKAFKARVKGFYLTPAHHLAQCKDAFDKYCAALGRSSAEAELDQLIEQLKKDFKEERKAAGYSS